ncbi:NACHT, LRR and PYD domains-containing protein 3-like isoform X2 [Colossoma macropomum]|uniref:NACHT, LRR and PYD domains-containing protein 3-like isoform X2 n=1 Tax=Colossoma macropomum TaxID=42526 RepID=UPI001864CEA6|nr:NACHT, LRR and PYD domains-containing protein 3-like isoform X2 [Colossoma macropomum]
MSVNGESVEEGTCLSGENDEGGAVHSETKRAASPVPSCASMKSDHSIYEPPAFNDGAKRSRSENQQTAAAVPSCVSMKSNHSMFEPPAFRDKAKRPRFDNKQEKTASSELSCVSMKSSHSMFEPPAFSNRPKHFTPENQQTAAAVPSCVSMKSNHSMFEPPAFRDKAKRPRFDTKQQRRASSELSCVSMKSSHSMFEPPAFSNEPKRSIYGLCGQIPKDPASSSCGHSFCTQCISRYWDQSGSSGNSDCPQCRRRSGTAPSLQPSTNIDSMEHKQPGEDILQKVLMNHKASMKSKYECLFEGIPTHENRTLLNSIYTQLYIIEGESEGVNEEHEVLQVQNMFQGCNKGIPVSYSDLFRPLPEQSLEKEHERSGLEERKFKTVLTKGIAGIGKTVSVQKFVLDWAEGKANQDIDFMFMLPFRELNLIKDDQYSLHGLLCVFHPELKELDPKVYDLCKIMFILDGLDESRISLNITASSQSKIISDVTKKTSVGVLMTNIIKGELLPSALIWITSRPAAASQIPSRYVSRVTEIQGFSDPQKEEYFKKRIRDPYQASRVFSQITKAKTLYIMCHIPIFCWISSIVIQQILEQDTCGEIPTTLTEMYIHFMLIQTKTKNLKYHVKDDDLWTREKEMILKLAELAFKQLIKGNILFYVEDLRECGIDVTEASVYSGVCTEIFKEESVLYQKKVFCFVHLSFQEFFAALFGFQACVEKNAEVVKMFKSRSSKPYGTFVDQFMKSAIDKALASKTGHLDLFLRFLCGISLESNRDLLNHILSYKYEMSEQFQESIRRVRQKHPKNVSADRWINFLHCFSEMKDTSFQTEAKTLLNAKKCVTGWDCTRIAHTLQTSKEVLDEFGPRKYKASDASYRRMIPVVRNCKKALLANMKLTNQDYEIVISALQSSNSVLIELDLSYNDIQDSGVKQLCACLRNQHCKLETLRLVTCNLTKQTCEYLALALQSANSALKELDLSQNDLEDSGVKLLSGGLESPHCQLEILRLSRCLVTEEGCASLASALSSNPSHLRELDLSYNHPEESGMKLLWAKVDDPNYKLDALNFNYRGVSRMKPGVRKYACQLTVNLNTIHNTLILSEENRKVTFVLDEKTKQVYPYHPERCEYPQLLCREGLTGRCYWEAEWSGWRAGIAVAYKKTIRQFGNDENSWGLFAFNQKYYFHHKDKKKFLPAPRSRSNRVGVYLDGPAGTLSFYSVLTDGSTLSHLHTVQCRFAGPLYAGIYVYDASVSLCHI